MITKQTSKAKKDFTYLFDFNVDINNIISILK